MTPRTPTYCHFSIFSFDSSGSLVNKLSISPDEFTSFTPFLPMLLTNATNSPVSSSLGVAANLDFCLLYFRSDVFPCGSCEVAFRLRCVTKSERFNTHITSKSDISALDNAFGRGVSIEVSTIIN